MSTTHHHPAIFNRTLCLPREDDDLSAKQALHSL